jgi:hypothetical protein
MISYPLHIKIGDLGPFSDHTRDVADADGTGQRDGATQTVPARPSAPKSRKRRGHAKDAPQLAGAPASGEATIDEPIAGRELSPAATNSDGHVQCDDRADHAIAGEGAASLQMPAAHVLPPLAELIALVRETHRQRTDLHNAEKRLTLQVKSICRRMCGGELKEADALYKAIAAEGSHALALQAAAWCRPLLIARDAISEEREAAEKRLAKAAKQLPAFAWVEATRGISAVSFGQIIGECGDLSNYANPAKVWKRMGLAVFDGERQRRVADAELAVKYGYSPRRRSIMYVVGENLIRANNPDYRAIYDARKAYEIERAPDMKPAHSHNRAKRYIEKRLLRDLWRAWRAATKPEATFPRLPPAEVSP